MNLLSHWHTGRCQLNINTGWSQDTSFLRLAGIYLKLGSAQVSSAAPSQLPSLPPACWGMRQLSILSQGLASSLSEGQKPMLFQALQARWSLRQPAQQLCNRIRARRPRDSGAQRLSRVRSDKTWWILKSEFHATLTCHWHSFSFDFFKY